MTSQHLLDGWEIPFVAPNGSREYIENIYLPSWLLLSFPPFTLAVQDSAALLPSPHPPCHGTRAEIPRFAHSHALSSGFSPCQQRRKKQRGARIFCWMVTRHDPKPGNKPRNHVESLQFSGLLAMRLPSSSIVSKSV